jgi:FixJ family two-component response regulator
VTRRPLGRTTGTPQGSILVVEDDDSMRAAVERLLGVAGHEAITFATAETLLASGAAQTAACVVSNLRLPVQSGLELLARFRERGWRLPLSLTTAYGTPGRREDALRCGASAYLVEPFSGTELLGAVKDAMAATATS